MKLQKLFFLGLSFINFASNGAETERSKFEAGFIVPHLYKMEIDCRIKINPFKKNVLMRTHLDSYNEAFRNQIVEIIKKTLNENKIPENTQYEAKINFLKEDGSITDKLNEINRIEAIITDSE